MEIDPTISKVMYQIFLLILKLSAPLAMLRLGSSGLRHMAGDNEAVSTAIRHVAVGLSTIILAETFVSLVIHFAEGVQATTSVPKVFW